MKHLLMIACLTFLAACSGSEQKTDEASIETHEHEVASKTYACPMSCEGEKTYTEAGTCPVCKMDLSEVAVVDADSTNTL
ncbi:hypothetical protein CLV98_102294 [Dyadobacter jejuensis]|uniref:Heavy metal binding domain-containing protein n=1 Tax=Dyadobacter jejuensis TaxID=1082580 RepID=A0A316APQ3_9BACT|nr:heavy metal-binding domain-containing protein [Dyadobacter jejuensis]PWJ59461.1 hypothetical protein CLV98_102294 [Dyadobacter jejuensis]